jgi:hypothetical protein
MLRHLSGAVLFEQEFDESWKRSKKIMHLFKSYLKQLLPRPIKNGLKKLMANRVNNR